MDEDRRRGFRCFSKHPVKKKKKKKKGVHVVIIYGNVMPMVHVHVYVHMHPRCHPLSLNPLVKTFISGQIIKQEKRNK